MLGLAEFSVDQPGWQQDLARAVGDAGDDETRVIAALLFAQALRSQYRLREAVEVCDRVAARLGGGDTESHLTLEAMAVACGMLDASTAPSVVDRAAALVARAWDGPVPRHAAAVGAWMAAVSNTPADQTAELAHRALAAGPRPLPEPGEPPWFHYAVVTLMYAERWAEAQGLFDAAVAEARAAGNGLALPGLLAHRASLALRRGDLTAAEADARALLDVPVPGLPAQELFRLLARGLLVAALVERGQLVEAEVQLEPGEPDFQGPSLATAVLRHAGVGCGWLSGASARRWPTSSRPVTLLSGR
jgi:hypothetical protein